MKISDDYGTAVVRIVDGEPELVSADDRICVSRELLNDPGSIVAVDGPFIGFLGLAYRATGEVAPTSQHDPIFERIL